ncbi:MAG: hypothetical protein JRH19_26900 [Deltaproteobacteria bacterium]|nr:hypothetical protein [Deltaproteobacteria bacterium]
MTATSHFEPTRASELAGTGTSKLRISAVLAARRKLEGSYTKLEKAIKNAIAPEGMAPSNVEGAPRFVDRRKLKSIVENDPKLVLSIGELRAIDLYLEHFGHGLAYNPLFEKRELLRHVADSGRVSFLLGSKIDESDPFRINISHWDFLSLDHIQTGVLGISPNVNTKSHEVLMRKEHGRARRDLGDERLNELFDNRGPSLVCLGSSRGNQMAEWMLCRMAEEPRVFQDAGPAARADLPFRFVWSSEHHSYVMPSQFHMHGAEADRENPEVGEAVLQRGAACLRHAGGYEIDELTDGSKGEGWTYALCAAQRRERGRVWLLVAGLTGPATYAASRWVDRMATDLDVLSEQDRSRVHWSIVRAEARKVERPNQSSYEVGNAEFVTGGVAWK